MEAVKNFEAQWERADAGHHAQSSREAELRQCLSELEKQRTAQLAQCFELDTKLSAEIEHLEGLRIDVRRRVEALEELYGTMADELTQAFREASSETARRHR